MTMDERINQNMIDELEGNIARLECTELNQPQADALATYRVRLANEYRVRDYLASK